MPIPANISDLSTTPGSNSPAGSESPATMDDYLRTHAAFIKQVSEGTGLASSSISTAKIADAAVTTAKIADDGVTFAKVQNVATSTILGRSTAGTGDIEALTGAQAAAIVAAASTTAQGVVELATDAEAQAGTDTSRAITAANLKAAQIQLGTPVTLTNQTAVDFTSIPSWVKRITVMFSGVSTNGTSLPIIQLGDSGGIEATGYLGSASLISTGVTSANNNTGFLVVQSIAAATVFHGSVTLYRLNDASTDWVASGVVGNSNAAATQTSAGSKTLSAALDRIRLTMVNGTDQFDAGTVNISYE